MLFLNKVRFKFANHSIFDSLNKNWLGKEGRKQTQTKNQMREGIKQTLWTETQEQEVMY